MRYIGFAGNRTPSQIVEITTGNRFVSRRNVKILRQRVQVWDQVRVQVIISLCTYFVTGGRPNIPRCVRKVLPAKRYAPTTDSRACETVVTEHGLLQSASANASRRSNLHTATPRPTTPPRPRHNQPPPHHDHRPQTDTLGIFRTQKGWQLSKSREGGAGSSDGKKRVPRFLIRAKI